MTYRLLPLATLAVVAMLACDDGPSRDPDPPAAPHTTKHHPSGPSAPPPNDGGSDVLHDASPSDAGDSPNLDAALVDAQSLDATSPPPKEPADAGATAVDAAI